VSSDIHCSVRWYWSGFGFLGEERSCPQKQTRIDYDLLEREGESGMMIYPAIPESACN
jgi:hypothetical protein